MHELNSEDGGILIALDGRRGSEGGYSNKEVVARAAQKANIIPVQYVDFCYSETNTSIIKYHPRREGYSSDDVIFDLYNRCPKAVIIDTLNQPFWDYRDYWRIVKTFPQTQFLLSHTGGFEMLNFINLLMYEKNAWFDFSFVQHVFGFCGSNNRLDVICDLMKYVLENKRLNHKLLFGTDNMRDEADVSGEALQVYEKYEVFENMIYDNYFEFLTQAHIV